MDYIDTHPKTGVPPGKFNLRRWIGMTVVIGGAAAIAVATNGGLATAHVASATRPITHATPATLSR